MVFWCTGGVLGRMLCRQEEKRQVESRAGKTHKEPEVPRHIKENPNKQPPRGKPGNGLGGAGDTRQRDAGTRAYHPFPGRVSQSELDASERKSSKLHCGLGADGQVLLPRQAAEQAAERTRPPHAELHGPHVEPQATGTIGHWLCMERELTKASDDV